MTSKQLYEAVLIELHKENAPNILLEDFNYLANKAVYLYINKRYNIYDISQQTTDDLRVLKATAILKPKRVRDYDCLTTVEEGMANFYVDLPSDYLHILNCICVFEILKSKGCYKKGKTCRFAATRLTADAYSLILDNYWLKPSYKRPYFYIHNINTNEAIPTNPYKEDGSGTDSANIFMDNGTDREGNLIGNGSNNPTTIKIKSNDNLPYSNELNYSEISSIERGQNIRYGNVSKVRMEIRYGTDWTSFSLDGNGQGRVYIDYLKTPLNICLTQEELDYTEDRSQVLEFPDYVCQEIVNELVHIIMENISDLRLQTHSVVSLSIANPAQALTPAASGKSAND